MATIREVIAKDKAKAKAEMAKLKALVAALKASGVSGLSALRGSGEPISKELSQRIRSKGAYDVAAKSIAPGAAFASQLLDLIPIADDATFADVRRDYGSPIAAARAVYKGAGDVATQVGRELLGEKLVPKKQQPRPSTGEFVGPSQTAATETKKRSSVTDVVKQFLDSGGKGVIRVSGDDFSYDEEKPRPTSSSVKWTAPNMGGGMTKEEAMLKVAQANAAGKSRAEALKVMGLLGPEGTKQLAAQIPGFRVWAGLDE